MAYPPKDQEDPSRNSIKGQHTHSGSDREGSGYTDKQRDHCKVLYRNPVHTGEGQAIHLALLNSICLVSQQFSFFFIPIMYATNTFWLSTPIITRPWGHRILWYLGCAASLPFWPSAISYPRLLARAAQHSPNKRLWLPSVSGIGIFRPESAVEFFLTAEIDNTSKEELKRGFLKTLK